MANIRIVHLNLVLCLVLLFQINFQGNVVLSSASQANNTTSIRIRKSDFRENVILNSIDLLDKKPKVNVVKFSKKKKEEPKKKKKKPIGNHWHGPILYGNQQWNKGKFRGGNNKIKAITPQLRRAHKRVIWVKTSEVKDYSWPTIMKTNEANDEKLIEICTPHFGPIRLMGNTVCIPLCRGCRNGDCVAPDKCRCFSEFVLTDNEDCVFTCPISCLNGHCQIRQPHCICNDGYALDPSGKYCQPICRAGCGSNPLHNCTDPDVCGCVRGYTLTDSDCQPNSGLQERRRKR